MFNCLNFLKKKKNLTIDTEIYGKFNLENITGNFYVESVYDGDTITLLVPTKLSIYNMNSSNTIDLSSNTNPTEQIILNKVRVRLYGIDTPELKPTKNLPNREEHITKAKVARDFLSELIADKVIKVSFLSNDKYGRPLVKIFIEEIVSISHIFRISKTITKEICLNDLMVEKGFAKKYDGKTKDCDFEFVEINIQ
jgi:endonuclease YncB( thermonuclease family)